MNQIFTGNKAHILNRPSSDRTQSGPFPVPKTETASSCDFSKDQPSNSVFWNQLPSNACLKKLQGCPGQFRNCQAGNPWSKKQHPRKSLSFQLGNSFFYRTSTGNDYFPFISNARAFILQGSEFQPIGRLFIEGRQVIIKLF